MRNTCIVEDCTNVARANNTPYCEKHYCRIRRYGTLELRKPKEQLEHSHGYMLLRAPDHPLTTRHTGKHEYEHRVVFYNNYGEGPFRCHWCGVIVTWDDMHVDHVDADKTNNDVHNLVSSCPLCNQQRGREKMIVTMRNKHATWIEYLGQRKTMGDWAEGLGITKQALCFRLQSGWDTEKALTTPRGKTGPCRKG